MSGPTKTDVVVAYVTVPSQEVAHQLGSSLLDARLAACVNILPGLQSMYRWEGKVQKDTELLLMIKSRVALMDSLTQHVRQNHPYDEPEVIMVPVIGGSPSYLKWVVDSTAAQAQLLDSGKGLPGQCHHADLGD